MGAIRLVQKPQNGQITFTVPDDMWDDTIIVDFHSVREQKPPSPNPNPGLAKASEAFFAKLNRVKTDFNEEDFNVYEQ